MRLFADAAGRPPTMWPEFVAEACAGEPELAGELRTLLHNLPRIDRFLDQPAELEPGEAPPPAAGEGAW
ncbi:MAG: hypothetical protein H6835_13890 [Planctomycetes bacterium]|nr:hypothetical protein [Planctomycetota bacterium]